MRSNRRGCGASPDLPAFAAAFHRRILALARTHDLLTRENWTGAPLGGVVRAGLPPMLLHNAQVDLSGCERQGMFLSAGAALTLAIHELATNAFRHGALSNPFGHVRVAYIATSSGEGTAHNALEWVERGGPPVPSPPEQRGFGLRLLERGLAMQVGRRADIRFESEGLHCTLHLPSSQPARPNGWAAGI